MESFKKTESIPKKQHVLELISRKNGSVTGVEKVLSACDTALLLSTSDGDLQIQGNGLKINRFNVDDGTLTFDGTVAFVKYNAAKVPFLKRIFK